MGAAVVGYGGGVAVVAAAWCGGTAVVWGTAAAVAAVVWMYKGTAVGAVGTNPGFRI